jgi:ribose 5-phosphate isomerase B
MKIFIASDHAGFELKKYLLEKSKVNMIDMGTHNTESCDYPIFANKLCYSVEEEEWSRGILICSTGVGMSIAANRWSQIRAALCFNESMAKLCRRHNDANVLVLGAGVISAETALNCFRIFLETEFEGGRHKRRLELIE